MYGLGQQFLSPENRARYEQARYGAGQVYETGRDVYATGQKVYGVIPPTWRPVLLGIVIGWWLRGK